MKEIIEGFKSLSKNLEKILKLLNKYGRIRENISENAYLVEKNLTEIIKTTETLPLLPLKTSLLSWIDSEKEALEKAKEDFRFSFGEALSELFAKEGKKIRGQYPTLRIGMYTIKLNFDFGEAVLYFGPEVEKLKAKISLNPKSIYEAVRKADEGLKNEKFEVKQFLNELYEAYRRRLLLNKKATGDKLPVVEVLNEFVIMKQPPKFFIDPRKENFHEYPRVKLSYFLYLLRKSNEINRGLRFYVATFDATPDKKASIWIPDNEEGEGTYYSYVSFEAEDKKLYSE